jgi:ATP-dependent Clp protease ATP-binding subunit ClpC
MLDSLQKRLDKLNIELEFSNKATNYIVSMAYDENEGARKLRRIIRRLVENPLTNKILQGEINKGDYLLADETDGKIIFISNFDLSGSVKS